MPNHLIAARAQPDGTFSLEQQNPELGKRLREGDATLGWLGDDRLSLHASRDDKGVRFEVWRNHEQGDPTLVASKYGKLGTGDSLIRMLAAHDTRLVDVGGNVLAERDRLKAERAKESHEYSEDKADKLAFALGRDLDMPAQAGRLYGTGK